jgi:hypothetical protein
MDSQPVHRFLISNLQLEITYEEAIVSISAFESHPGLGLDCFYTQGMKKPNKPSSYSVTWAFPIYRLKRQALTK